jgi:hypothetical protein
LPSGCAVPPPVVVVAGGGALPAGFVAVTPQLGLALHFAMYTEMSSAFWPSYRFAGIGSSG